MVMAIALVLLVVGSVLFHYLSPWYFTPIASNWDAIDETVTITFWVTGFVFVVVNLFMAYCVWRYRHRKGMAALYQPEGEILDGSVTVVQTFGFFFSSRRRHTRLVSDWSSDVCSSD